MILTSTMFRYCIMKYVTIWEISMTLNLDFPNDTVWMFKIMPGLQILSKCKMDHWILM